MEIQNEMEKAFLIFWKHFMEYVTMRAEIGLTSATYISYYLKEKEEFIKNWKEAHNAKQGQI